jgi:glycosidase
LEGQYIALNQDDPNVLAYLRRYKDEAVMVVLNMSGEAQKVSFDLAPQGLSGKATTLLTTLSSAPKEVGLSQVALEPFAVYIGKVAK